MIQLFAQLSLINNIGNPQRLGAVDQAERDIRIWLVAKHRLAHQQLVKIRVDQRPHNRIDLPFVVINTGSDIDHDAASDWFKAVKAGV